MSLICSWVMYEIEGVLWAVAKFNKPQKASAVAKLRFNKCMVKLMVQLTVRMSLDEHRDGFK